ncbi:P-loop containing nucleoside triphosphate hydrolase protein [Mycena filopes]|nr:P-loop containing nucleoside triphosphate hydrolase protein [Mycena filopes]
MPSVSLFLNSWLLSARSYELASHCHMPFIALLFAPMDDWDEWFIRLLGAGNVGKTALAVQFAFNSFVGETGYPTIDESHRKQLTLDDRISFVDAIDTDWEDVDPASNASSREPWPRETKGFILVYSVASRSSFDRVADIRKSVTRKDAVFVLVGNKCDVTDGREVSGEEGAALARDFGCPFLETSAKTAENVELAFATVVRALRDRFGASSKRILSTKLKKRKNKCIIL